MRIDMEQSCRALCSIEKFEQEQINLIHIIPNSPDMLQVDALRKRKALIPNETLLPKGVSSQDYMNILLKSADIKFAQKQDKPEDIIDLLQEQEMELDFDLLASLRSWGNQILSLFKGGAGGSEPDEDKDDHITIEISEDNSTVPVNHTMLLGSQKIIPPPVWKENHKKATRPMQVEEDKGPRDQEALQSSENINQVTPINR